MFAVMREGGGAGGRRYVGSGKRMSAERADGWADGRCFLGGGRKGNMVVVGESSGDGPWAAMVVDEGRCGFG